MAQIFIIMQIGNDDLDEMCRQVMVPAAESCGYEAKRVDKHNEGGLLKSEIIEFIQHADIIIADLTNERPNCYLEIGYAMGLDKFRNLILTAREDHSPESPNFVKGGPKIHFDLSGYDILFWHQDRLDEFRDELEKRIKRRRAILAPTSGKPATPWNETWISAHREAAMPKLRETGKTGFMEIRFALDPPKPAKTQQELNEAARTATISTFGWPIAVYLDNRDEFRPRPRADGIVAEIATDNRETFDYWSIAKNGDFYLLKTIFEDERDPRFIFFSTRIVRVTETLLYCARLYNRLEIDPATPVNVAVRHGGLKDRLLKGNSRRYLASQGPTDEDECETMIRCTLEQLESGLVEHVKALVHPLFTLFDFFELSDPVYEDIVNKFVKGEAS